jgi:hypothetical protein
MKEAYNHLKSRDFLIMFWLHGMEVTKRSKFQIMRLHRYTHCRKGTDNEARLITYLSTVMEKADIPTRTECIQKFHEGPRPFWKNEPVNKFILYF